MKRNHCFTRSTVTAGCLVILLAAVAWTGFYAQAADSVAAPAITPAGKLAYERTLLEVHALLIKGDVTAALAQLEVAKAEPSLEPLRASLDLEQELAHVIDDLNKAAIDGAAALADKRAFVLRKSDGKELEIGQGAKNSFNSIKDQVLFIDQDLGGAKALVKWKFSELSASTRNDLAAISLPKGGDTALKLAYAGVVTFGTPTPTPLKTIQAQLEIARKEKVDPEKIAQVQERIDALNREPLAKAAVLKIEAACKAKKWKEASTLIDAAKVDFAGSQFFEKSRSDVDKWFAELDAKFNPLLIPNAPVDDEWCAAVRKLPVADQLKTVVDKLKKLNPGFEGAVTPTIRDNSIVSISFPGANAQTTLVNISPIHALSDLEQVWAPSDGRIEDISALKGMRLNAVSFRHCRVKDISPLKGMPLRIVDVAGPASDLTVLEGMPLENVKGTISLETAKVLKRAPNLKWINDKPAEETWKLFGGLADLKPDERPKVAEPPVETAKRWPFAELPDVLWYEDFEAGGKPFLNNGGPSVSSALHAEAPCLPGNHALKLADWDRGKAKGERWSIAYANVTNAKASFPNGAEPTQVMIHLLFWSDDDGELTLKLKHRDGEYFELHNIPKANVWTPVVFKLSELRNKSFRPDAKDIITGMEIQYKSKSHTNYPNCYIDDVIVTKNTPPATALQWIKALEKKKP